MILFRLTLFFRLSAPASAPASALALELALALPDIFAIAFSLIGVILTLASGFASWRSGKMSIRLLCAQMRLDWHDCGTILVLLFFLRTKAEGHEPKYNDCKSYVF